VGCRIRGGNRVFEIRMEPGPLPPASKTRAGREELVRYALGLPIAQSDIERLLVTSANLSSPPRRSPARDPPFQRTAKCVLDDASCAEQSQLLELRRLDLARRGSSPGG